MNKKKKLFSKAISLVCCLVFSLLAVVGSGCKEKQPNEGTIATPTTPAYNGTHIYTKTPTANSFVTNGKTDYVVVVPQGYSADIKMAKDEFVYFLREATGANVSWTTDEGLSYDANKKYISLGYTSLYETVAAEDESKQVSYEKVKNGFQIFTKGKSMFLVGGNDCGTLYSVYEFMKQLFNLEIYATRCIVIDEGVKNVPLYNFDIIDIPDIEFRTKNHGFMWEEGTYDEKMIKYRMRMNYTSNDINLPVYSTYDYENPGTARVGAHTATAFIPVSNKEAHPKWFSDALQSSADLTKVQLCYTARGDAEEYALMIQEFYKKIIMSLTLNPPSKYPYRNAINIGNEDNSNHCSCDSCMAVIEKYGARSALMILLWNDIIPLVEEWMNQPENAEYKRDMRYAFIAYEGMEPAPASYDEKLGKYVPNNGLVIHEKIKPTFCPINFVEYKKSFYHEINKQGKINHDAWNDLTDMVDLYTYDHFPRQYMFMYDTFDYYTNDYYRYAANMNARSLYIESQMNQDGTSTAFHGLRAYLQSKLMWNVDLDMEQLIDDYFDNVFLDAADTIREIFYSTRAYINMVNERDKNFNVRSLFQTVAKEQNWNYQTLLGWLAKYDQAYEQIEKYKTIDYQLYENMHYHITQEWMSPAYITLTLHTDKMESASAKALLARFKEGQVETKMSNTGASTSLDEWIQSMEEEVYKR